MTRTPLASLGRRAGRLLAATGFAALAAAPSAFADPSRSYELVTPAGSVPAEPVAVHPFKGGDGFGYRTFDGQLGSLEGMWASFTAGRTATGWDNAQIGAGVPVHYTQGGTNTRQPVATQTLGYSADGRTTWVLTMLPLVPEDENTPLADYQLGGTGSSDIYAITDGKPTLITRDALGKAASIGNDVADVPSGLPQFIATQGNKLAFVLNRNNGQVIAESDPAVNLSIFIASADGSVQRVDAAPAGIPLQGRPISDDGKRLVYLKAGQLSLWNDGVTTALGPITGGAHLSADGAKVTWLQKLPADPFARIRQYDVASGTATVLSAAYDASAPTAAAALSDTSDDGKTVVFTSRDRLTADTPAPGTAVLPNYYAHTGGALHYIGQSAVWSSVRTTDNGNVFFTTTTALLPADTDTVADLYRWNRATGLQLLSANGSFGNTATAVTFAAPRNVPMALGQDIWGMPAERNRLSELTSADGAWAFFSSTEKLTADAGDNSRNKVYGSHDGELVLISPPGDDATEARYINNSPSGRDVFFVTDQPLDWRDTDGDYLDVYDARVGGGFGPKPAGPVDPCPGNACALPAPAAPSGAPATSTASGPGNSTPAADPSNRFSVKGKPATKLKLDLPGAGQLTFSATTKVGKTKKTVLTKTVDVTKSGVQTVQLKLNTTGSKALKQAEGKRLKLKVQITFEPEGGFVRTQTVSVTFTTKSGKR